MTATELKSILLSIADTLDTGAKIFPLDLDTQLITLLMNLDDTSTKILAAVLNMSVDDFKKLIPNIITILQAAHKLFATDEHTKISNFCRAIANRSFLLYLLAPFI